MCGITGILSFTDKGRDTQKKTGVACDWLKQRGPDGGGVLSIGDCSLGHRRLSIIDISENATQPMVDRTNRFTIVFNGEIFNYKELRRDHFPAEYPWLSESDTEVLLELYIQKGRDCLPLLSGFFAFAIYDSQQKKLFLARDRYGKKPLLFYQTEDYLVFASEMKALLAYDIPRQLNNTALSQYLELNYIPPDNCILEGVEKLPAGHYAEVKEGQIEAGRYYELDWKSRRYARLSYEEACEQLTGLMAKSVRKRLISDVPVGAFLSGGIDSSVVVALASRYTSHLNTFSIGYADNPFFDETAYAELVAKKYKTDHTVFSLKNDDFLSHIDDVLNYLDEPFADSSAIPLYILSKETRKYATVALSGDGGDEVFAGYNKHQAEWRMRQPSLLSNLVKAGAPIWKKLPKSRNNKLTNIFRQLDRFADGAKLDVKERYWRWAGFLPKEDAAYLLTPESRNRINVQEYAINKENFTGSLIGDKNLEDFLAADMQLVLGGDMLVKVDMMSMANSLEVRSPFLDHEVVDFAFSLPTSYKVDGKMKKKIVQDAFRSMLPQELYNRPKKGFEIPLLSWFRGDLRRRIEEDWLNNEYIHQQGIFNPSAIQELKKRLFSGNPGDSHATIWALIVFQSWWKRYFMR